MTDHFETPGTDDVEGHFQAVDDEGLAVAPPTRRPLVAADDDDVEGHVLDLDIERRR